jgi:iron-sulfur cluster repair protein YtfE (RIC family)
MVDDLSKTGAGDRDTVAAGETYEVDYFARKHDLTREETRALIAEVGNDRKTLEAAVADGKPVRAKTATPAKPARKRTTVAPARKRSAVAKVEAVVAAVPVVKAVRKTVAEATDAVAAETTKVGKTAVKLATKARSATAKVAAAPVAAVAPAAKEAADSAASLAKAARKTVKSATATATAAPASARKSAAKVADRAKSAATGRTAALFGAAAAGIVTGLAVNLGRKAIVQAPSVVAGDWLEALKVEHKLALAIFDQIAATTDDQPAKRAVLLTQLKHALGKHAFTEENVVYAALRDWGDKADADKLNHDHGYVKQYLYDLDNLDNASPAFLDKIAAFRADLEAHIREEEDSIFPQLHAGLGEAGNAKVTAAANKEGFKLA